MLYALQLSTWPSFGVPTWFWEPCHQLDVPPRDVVWLWQGASQRDIQQIRSTQRSQIAELGCWVLFVLHLSTKFVVV